MSDLGEVFGEIVRPIVEEIGNEVSRSVTTRLDERVIDGARRWKDPLPVRHIARSAWYWWLLPLVPAAAIIMFTLLVTRSDSVSTAAAVFLGALWIVPLWLAAWLARTQLRFEVGYIVVRRLWSHRVLLDAQLLSATVDQQTFLISALAEDPEDDRRDIRWNLCCPQASMVLAMLKQRARTGRELRDGVTPSSRIALRTRR